jgi:hypothetical protein
MKLVNNLIMEKYLRKRIKELRKEGREIVDSVKVDIDNIHLIKNGITQAIQKEKLADELQTALNYLLSQNETQNIAENECEKRKCELDTHPKSCGMYCVKDGCSYCVHYK